MSCYTFKNCTDSVSCTRMQHVWSWLEAKAASDTKTTSRQRRHTHHAASLGKQKTWNSISPKNPRHPCLPALVHNTKPAPIHNTKPSVSYKQDKNCRSAGTFAGRESANHKARSGLLCLSMSLVNPYLPHQRL